MDTAAQGRNEPKCYALHMTISPSTRCKPRKTKKALGKWLTRRPLTPKERVRMKRVMQRTQGGALRMVSRVVGVGYGKVTEP